MTYDTICDVQTMQLGAVGQLLANRYRIIKQLGQGGMGSVWLAEDTQLDGKLFAIKMLPSILVSNKRAYRQLKDEALVAMQLVHPNIVQIRAFEENNGNPFLVMDYVDGQTLDDYLADKMVGRVVPNAPRRLEDKPPYQTQAGLPEDEVIRILKPIAAALDYAHSKGVVHRDVKPGNVMIAKDGTPYILDFGIAREIQETMTRVTGKLSSGTLLYMSPEQLRGQPPKPAQDVYSFAAMVYECLSGTPPFYRGAVEDQIKNEQPEPLGPHIIISGRVAQGLSKKPEDRQKTCAAVLEGDVLTHSHQGTYPPEGRPQDGCPKGRGEAQRKGDDGIGCVEHVERVEGMACRPSRIVIPESDWEYLPEDAKCSRVGGFSKRPEGFQRENSTMPEKGDSRNDEANRRDYRPVPAQSGSNSGGGGHLVGIVAIMIAIIMGGAYFYKEHLERERRWKSYRRDVDERNKRRNEEFAKEQEGREREAARLAAEHAEMLRKQAENARIEAEKPRVYLTATLNGVPKSALITTGMAENNKYRTPLNVNVMIPVGSQGTFEAEYVENGVKYVGKSTYTARKGLQNVTIVLEKKQLAGRYECNARETWGGDVTVLKHVYEFRLDGTLELSTSYGGSINVKETGRWSLVDDKLSILFLDEESYSLGRRVNHAMYGRKGLTLVYKVLWRTDGSVEFRPDAASHIGWYKKFRGDNFVSYYCDKNGVGHVKLKYGLIFKTEIEGIISPKIFKKQI